MSATIRNHRFIEAAIHFHPLPRLHAPRPHVDLRHLGRDAIIAVELGLSATVVAGSDRTTGRGSEAAVVREVAQPVNAPLSVEVHSGTLGVFAIVRGADPSAAIAVSLVSESGEPVTPVSTESGLRFEDVPVGRYRVVVSSEGPIIDAGGATISSAVVVRSEPFALLTPGLVVVESR